MQPQGNSFALMNMGFTDITIITLQKPFTHLKHLISYTGVFLQENLEPVFLRSPAQSSQDKMQTNIHSAICYLQPHSYKSRLTAILDIWTYRCLLYLGPVKDLYSILPVVLTNNPKISPWLFQQWKDIDNAAQLLQNFAEFLPVFLFSALFLSLQPSWERSVALATSQHSAWT